MKIRMLVSISGASGTASPGDVWECDSEEAGRLINAGYAQPIKTKRRTATEPSTETAVTD